jgi:hypothetical protein
MNQPTQPPAGGSLFQRVENIKWLMRFPALTVMIFFRKHLGYRLLNPLHILVVTGAIIFLSLHLQNGNPEGGGEDLMWFGIVAFCLGMLRRAMSWKELQLGLSVHSYYIGTSPFEFRWLPAYLLRQRRMARFADPLFCIVLGFLYARVSAPLGYWLMFAGLSTRAFEDAVFRKELNRDLDLADGLIMSDVYTRSVERFSQPPPQSTEQSSGLPTGLAADVQMQMNRRKTK